MRFRSVGTLRCINFESIGEQWTKLNDGKTNVNEINALFLRVKIARDMI